MLHDSFNLGRFLSAQSAVYSTVLSELRGGRKLSHWMWFVFPQISGLGTSATANKFAISGLREAVAYAGHPILGCRLEECTRLVNNVEGRTAQQIFDTPDYLKFRSSMTLFAIAKPTERAFKDALDKYFSGKPDQLTVSKLRSFWPQP